MQHTFMIFRRYLALSGSVIPLAALAAAQPAAAAPAQTAAPSEADDQLTLPTDEIVVTGAHANQETMPTRVLLDTYQPMSVISDSFIHDSTAPTGNYDTSIKVSPSVNAANPGGPGLSDGKSMSIRGFQDGQFNMTFDGIPWGDSTNFAHNSASWFTNRYLNSIAVDRGPGTASTIGSATFGGTVSLFSKAPENHLSIAPYASYGSSNTWQLGAELNSGEIQSLGGAKIMLVGEHVASDGMLSYASSKRTNVFGKMVVPLGPDTTLTLAAMYNDSDLPKLPGATLAQTAQFGKDYQFNNDPRSQSYWGYNRTSLKNDFEYIQLRSELSDSVVVSDQIYSYRYGRVHRNPDDPNGTAALASSISGRYDNSIYRSIGNIFRFVRKGKLADVQFGFWADHSNHFNEQYSANYTADTIENPARTATRGYLHNSLDTLQGYVQLDIRPVDGLTISPGVRYVYFNRAIDAVVNKNTRKPLQASIDFKSWIPSIAVNYKVAPNWSLYAQAAKGYLAPPVDYLYVADPQQSNVSPQETVNYQAGTAYSTGALSLAADVYLIDFRNMVIGRSVSGGDTIYSNAGGVIYKGAEAEVSYRLGMGFSLYANGSVNSAKTKGTHITLLETPKATAAVSVQYDNHGTTAALVNKWVGSRFGDVDETQPLNPYNQLDFNIGHSFKASGIMPAFKVNLQVANVLDSRKVYSFVAYDKAGDALYYTQPGRSVFLSLSVKP